MFYGKPEASDEVVVYLQVAIPIHLKFEDAEARQGMTMNASESKTKDNNEENI